MSFSFALSWRSPSLSRFTTSTHGSPNSPPGIRPRAVGGDRHAPVGHDPARQLVAGLGVDHRDRSGEDGAGARARPHLPTRAPSATMQRDPIMESSPTITGAACGGSSTPPMPTPPERCTRSPICAQEPDRRPGVDHRVGTDAGADVHVARHHHRAGSEVGAPSRRRARHHTHALRAGSGASAGSCRRTRTARARWSPSGRAGTAGAPRTSATRGRRRRRRPSPPPGPRRCRAARPPGAPRRGPRPPGAPRRGRRDPPTMR